MKEPKPIPRQSAKIKRGTEFIIKETGEVVKFHIIDPEGNYLVQRVNGSYDPFTADELKEAVKGRGTIKQVQNITPEKKQFRQELNVFFASQILTMPDECENCGEPLNAYNKFFKRCVSAHILEKSRFPTVAIHPKNLIFLGSSLVDSGCECHNLFDEKGAEFRSKMKCYPLVIERFNQFKHLLTEAELVKACKYLNIEFE